MKPSRSGSGERPSGSGRGPGRVEALPEWCQVLGTAGLGRIKAVADLYFTKSYFM